MSHASVIVAVSPEDVAAAGGLAEAVSHQMAPFDESGQWFREGSRWDWWEIGGRFSGKLLGKDVMTRGAMDPAAMSEYNAGLARERWADYQESLAKNGGIAGFLFGMDEGETEESHVKKHSVPLTAYAFLKDREWHECGRMGWFGASAPTECELRAEEEGREFTGRCLHTCERTGAKVVSWTGPKDSREQWQQLFWRRFVQNLPDDTTLVVVDYHV